MELLVAAAQAMEDCCWRNMFAEGGKQKKGPPKEIHDVRDIGPRPMHSVKTKSGVTTVECVTRLVCDLFAAMGMPCVRKDKRPGPLDAETRVRGVACFPCGAVSLRVDVRLRHHGKIETCLYRDFGDHRMTFFVFQLLEDTIAALRCTVDPAAFSWKMLDWSPPPLPLSFRPPDMEPSRFPRSCVDRLALPTMALAECQFVASRVCQASPVLVTADVVSALTSVLAGADEYSAAARAMSSVALACLLRHSREVVLQNKDQLVEVLWEACSDSSADDRLGGHASRSEAEAFGVCLKHQCLDMLLEVQETAALTERQAQIVQWCADAGCLFAHKGLQTAAQALLARSTL